MNFTADGDGGARCRSDGDGDSGGDTRTRGLGFDGDGDGDGDGMGAEERGLKWSFNANRSKKALDLSCQRNRLRRRWAGAFTRALGRAGLDGKGRVRREMVGSGGSGGARGGLHGTLEVQITRGAGWEEETKVLERMMEGLVGVLVQRARRGAGEETWKGDGDGDWGAEGYVSSAGIARQRS